jgi:hypothetical protein
MKNLVMGLMAKGKWLKVEALADSLFTVIPAEILSGNP